MTVDTIKNLIEDLPPRDQAALASWMGWRDARTWDSQIERDFTEGGGGMALLEEVDALIDSGDLTNFRVSQPRGRVD
jgi:hypothetical protein